MLSQQAFVQAPREDFARVFDDVLCALDASPDSLAAVAQAAALAAPGGRLTLLGLTDPTACGRFFAAAIGPQRVDRVLSRAARTAASLGVQVARLIDPAGPPAEAILDEASRHELLAIGGPSGSPLAALVAAAIGSAGLDSFATPLLAARPEHEGSPLNILVATDASDASRRVIDVACRVGGGRAERVMLLHSTGGGAPAQTQRVESQARELELVCGDVCELLVAAVPPDEAILRAAAGFGASLIVIGSRRVGGLWALGSVSRRVLADAPCSVLVVPPGS